MRPSNAIASRRLSHHGGAAFKLGQITDAANLINIVRTRAAANAGAIAAMTANTEADVTATSLKQ